MVTYTSNPGVWEADLFESETNMIYTDSSMSARATERDLDHISNKIANNSNNNKPNYSSVFLPKNVLQLNLFRFTGSCS